MAKIVLSTRQHPKRRKVVPRKAGRGRRTSQNAASSCSQRPPPAARASGRKVRPCHDFDDATITDPRWGKLL